MNVICWPSIVEEYRREVMSAELLGVYGIWQSDHSKPDWLILAKERVTTAVNTGHG